MTVTAATTRPVAAGKRVTALDWLRVLVVVGLIPYHAAVVFAAGPGDYVKSPRASLVFDLVATLVSFLGMPLLFLVSGGATWFALERRRPARYLLERAARLAIPFVFGVLLVVPVQLYVARRATPGYHLTYLQFYWTFLVDWANIARHGVFGRGFEYWGHLWFILYLLAVSVFLLPLLLWLRSPPAQRPLTYLASRCGQVPGLFLLGAPLVLVEVALAGPIGPRAWADYSNLYSGAAGLVLYAVAFVLGYLLFSDQGYQQALIRWWQVALIQAGALLLVHEAALAALGQSFVADPLGALVVRGLRAYITWCLLVGTLGFALRYLGGWPAPLRYLQDACYPVYVLHLPVLTVLASAIVGWGMPLFINYLALLGATAALTFALYEVVVRRIPPVRFLFGLKLQPAA